METANTVLVVGAGPTGLLVAGDLATAGIDVTVLERRPAGASNLSRAFTVHARTLELLDARGLADELVAAGGTIDELNLFLRMELDLTRLPSRFRYVLAVPQYETERLLLRRAVDAGATIQHGADVVALRQDGAGVEVDVRDESGRTRTVRGGYLVAADGYHGTVRNLLGLPFPGGTAVKSIMLADVRMAQPPAEQLFTRGRAKALSLVAGFGDGWYRVMAWDKANDLPADAPVSLADVRDVLVATHGTDYGMSDPRWISRFQSDERQLRQYRVGRVLLAGDAAHVHTPAGGQGMNTGLQDGANLSWKLAATVHGWAPDGLLDSYQAERWPVGRMVLRTSGLMMRLAMAHNGFRRGLRTLAALVVGRVPVVNRAVRGMISGIGIAYRAPRGAGRMAGRRAPDVALDGGRLYEALRGGTFVLIVPAGQHPPVAGRADRVRLAHWAGDRRDSLLVRPDGYVAWAGDSQAGLADALRRWTATVAVAR